MMNLATTCPPKCSFCQDEQLFSLGNLPQLPISRLIVDFLPNFHKKLKIVMMNLATTCPTKCSLLQGEQLFFLVNLQ